MTSPTSLDALADQVVAAGTLLGPRTLTIGFARRFATYKRANLLLGPVDAVLAGLSTEAAAIVEPDRVVSAAGNYWFLMVSTVLVTAVVSLVTVRITEPRVADRPADNSDEDLAPRMDRRALGWTLAVLALGVLAVVLLVAPADAPLRGEDGGLLQSPFMSSLVVLIALLAGLCGAVYGRVSGRFRSAGGIIEAMETTMSSMSGYLVLMFFAAQFVAWFSYSQLGLVLAIKGAAWLGGLNLPTVALLLLFVGLVALINLMIGSASAKWGILAPVFVPMLMLVGIDPEATQAAYRVGDSSTNIITPLMPYFALVLGFARRYRSDTGIGTLIALMLPYSLALLAGRPEVMNLRDMIEAFVRFREVVIARRTRHLLGKARDRAHVLVGLAIAVANIDEMIRIEHLASRHDPNTEVSKINEALRRMDNDEYGICDECCSGIDKGRLEAHPYARKCIDCARFEEHRRAHT